jgi:hypothetical protein
MTVAPGPSLAIESIALETRKEEWVEIQDPQSGNIFYANPVSQILIDWIMSLCFLLTS